MCLCAAVARSAVFEVIRVIWARKRRRSRRSASIRFDARELDHFSPLLGFGGDELLAFGRRHGHWYDAEVGKPRLEPRVGKNRIDLRVEHLSDLDRRGFRSTEPLPGARLEPRYEFAHRRYIR